MDNKLTFKYFKREGNHFVTYPKGSILWQLLTKQNNPYIQYSVIFNPCLTCEHLITDTEEDWEMGLSYEIWNCTAKDEIDDILEFEDVFQRTDWCSDWKKENE